MRLAKYPNIDISYHGIKVPNFIYFLRFLKLFIKLWEAVQRVGRQHQSYHRQPFLSVVLMFCSIYLMFKGVDFIFLSPYLMFLVGVFMYY